MEKANLSLHWNTFNEVLQKLNSFLYFSYLIFHSYTQFKNKEVCIYISIFIQLLFTVWLQQQKDYFLLFSGLIDIVWIFLRAATSCVYHGRCIWHGVGASYCHIFYFFVFFSWCEDACIDESNTFFYSD